LAQNGPEVQLTENRQQLVKDSLELFSSRPNLDIFRRWWRDDATFEDPLSVAEGFKQYAAQWFAMHKAFPQSRTLEYRILSSTTNPNQVTYALTQEYTIRFLGVKKVMNSVVVIDLDENEKIVKLQDMWNGKEHPHRFGIWYLRKLNAKTMPLLVSIPKTDKHD
jgi:hypothetical protein